MLTLQFIPYVQIEDLPSQKRIDKILSLVKTDKILVLEGRRIFREKLRRRPRRN